MPSKTLEEDDTPLSSSPAPSVRSLPGGLRHSDVAELQAFVEKEAWIQEKIDVSILPLRFPPGALD